MYDSTRSAARWSSTPYREYPRFGGGLLFENPYYVDPDQLRPGVARPGRHLTMVFSLLPDSGAISP